MGSGRLGVVWASSRPARSPKFLPNDHGSIGPTVLFVGAGGRVNVPSGRVSLEAQRVEVMAGQEADVGVKGVGELAEQSNSGLGAAFFDALDVVDGHRSAHRYLGDAKSEGLTPVIDGFAEGEGFADRDPLVRRWPWHWESTGCGHR